MPKGLPPDYQGRRSGDESFPSPSFLAVAIVQRYSKLRGGDHYTNDDDDVHGAVSLQVALPRGAKVRPSLTIETCDPLGGR